MSARVLTVGETMALLDPVGEFAHGCHLTLRLAGAESNMAIGLTRLGIPVRWISRVGADPFGDVILETLAAEGVDVSLVKRDTHASTGLFYKVRHRGRTHVAYFRNGSAASRLEVADVPDASLDGVSLVHLTGITLGLSGSARALAVSLARRAHERGITLIFDPNWRSELWPSAAAAAAACADLLPYADWVLCGAEEGRVLFGGGTPEATIAAIRRHGARHAIVRVGAGGAVAVADGRAVTVVPERLVDVVDEVGAGDAFAAGFAYGLLEQWPLVERVRLANRLAGAALEGPGDWETLPRLNEIDLGATHVSKFDSAHPRGSLLTDKEG